MLKRFLAFAIDALLISLPSALFHPVLPFLVPLLLWFFYFPVLEASRLQGTLGKCALGMKVTDLQFARLSLKRALMRNIFKLFSGALFGMGYVLAFFTARKQALHDLLADTLILSGSVHVDSVAEEWFAAAKQAVNSSLGLAKGRMPLSAASEAESQAAATPAYLAELEKLFELYQKGALTQVEYEIAKNVF